MRTALFLVLTISLNILSAQAPRQENIRIPGSDVSFGLALLPSATFKMGSPTDEKGRKPNEGQHDVQLDSFWIGVHEVTFDELFLFEYRAMDTDSSSGDGSYKADAIARPSPPYFDYTYGRGKKGGFPASTMTQQAALRYCEWLSDKTGDFYRLPTEAEWEYACRAGASTTFSWGDDPAKAAEYAWFYDNSKGSYQPVGTKKPNPWGLYDMHGNVAEWTLDFYDDNYYAKLDSNAVNPWILPLRKHSRTVKGGSFDDYPDDLRCAARKKSDPKWQARDPQNPKSRWWNPDSPFLGFRLVRETRHLSKAERTAFYEKAIK